MQPWEKASHWSRAHSSLNPLTYALLMCRKYGWRTVESRWNLVWFFDGVLWRELMVSLDWTLKPTHKNVSYRKCEFSRWPRLSSVILANKPLKALCLSFIMVYQHLLYFLSLWAVSISLSLLEKEWRDFICHFSLLGKSESYLNFTLFSWEKRVKYE